MFPLGKTGGLIEALVFVHAHGVGQFAFPLGKTGGLIEAVGSIPNWRHAWCFRWVKPAASLKPWYLCTLMA